MGSASDLAIVIYDDLVPQNIFRVPDYVKAFSPDDFKPMEWRLGLHTHTGLSTTSGLDIFKVAVAGMVARGPGSRETTSHGKDLMTSETWLALWKDIELDLEKAEAAYDGRTPTPPHDQDPASAGGVLHRYPHAALLAIDALFLCAYLRSRVYVKSWGYKFRRVVWDSRCETRAYPLYRDLLILDNQLPMTLLLAVIRHLSKAEALRKNESSSDGDLDTGARETLNGLLLDVVAEVYPFAYNHEVDRKSGDLRGYLTTNFPTTGIDALWKCDHILACAYQAICGGLKPEPDWNADISDVDHELVSGANLDIHAQDAEPAPGWRSKLKLRAWSGKNVEEAAKASHRNRCRVPSATRLRRSGVNFKVTKQYLGLLQDIKFDNHTLLLPKLVMDVHTITRFRNLALHEQLLPQDIPRVDFRTYLLLMSNLVENAQDVRLLIDSNVLVHHLSNDEAAAREWNGMCQALGLGLFNPAKDKSPKYWTKLQDYVKTHDEVLLKYMYWWVADFRTVNCADPWRITLFTLACLITVVTFIQAALAIATYSWSGRPYT